MRNRWVDALVITLVVLLVVHIIMIVLGLIWGMQIGWFGLPMIWAHWEASTRAIVAVILLVVLYFCIYAWATGRRD